MCCTRCDLVAGLQMEKRIEQNTIVARTLVVQKKKQQALLALKRKRLSENQLHNIQTYLMNVEDMVWRRLWNSRGTSYFGQHSAAVQCQARPFGSAVRAVQS